MKVVPTVQLKMMRRIVHVRRQSGEALSEYMSRAARKVKNLRLKHAIESWDASYHRSVFSWAGHLARMAAYSPDRASHQVLLYKNWDWIQEQSDDRGNQFHCRKLRVWRWERPLYKYFHPNRWQDKASDKSVWNSLLNEMVEWRNQAR